LRREDTVTPQLELDDIEEMIREEVLEALLGRQQLCSCGQLIETGEMFSAHVLPCPHCRKQKCSECTALAMEVRAKSSCCESCAMACNSCVRRLRLSCSRCDLGRRCLGAGCGGVRCSTCFNQVSLRFVACSHVVYEYICFFVLALRGLQGARSP
jgi:hypothetical protein